MDQFSPEFQELIRGINEAFACYAHWLHSQQSDHEIRNEGAQNSILPSSSTGNLELITTSILDGEYELKDYEINNKKECAEDGALDGRLSKRKIDDISDFNDSINLQRVKTLKVSTYQNGNVELIRDKNIGVDHTDMSVESLRIKNTNAQSRITIQEEFVTSIDHQINDNDEKKRDEIEDIINDGEEDNNVDDGSFYSEINEENVSTSMNDANEINDTGDTGICEEDFSNYKIRYPEGNANEVIVNEARLNNNNKEKINNHNEPEDLTPDDDLVENFELAKNGLKNQWRCEIEKDETNHNKNTISSNSKTNDENESFEPEAMIIDMTQDSGEETEIENIEEPVNEQNNTNKDMLIDMTQGFSDSNSIDESSEHSNDNTQEESDTMEDNEDVNVIDTGSMSPFEQTESDHGSEISETGNAENTKNPNIIPLNFNDTRKPVVNHVMEEGSCTERDKSVEDEDIHKSSSYDDDEEEEQQNKIPGMVEVRENVEFWEMRSKIQKYDVDNIDEEEEDIPLEENQITKSSIVNRDEGGIETKFLKTGQPENFDVEDKFSVAFDDNNEFYTACKDDVEENENELGGYDVEENGTELKEKSNLNITHTTHSDQESDNEDKSSYSVDENFHDLTQIPSDSSVSVENDNLCSTQYSDDEDSMKDGNKGAVSSLKNKERANLCEDPYGPIIASNISTAYSAFTFKYEDFYYLGIFMQYGEYEEEEKVRKFYSLVPNDNENPLKSKFALSSPKKALIDVDLVVIKNLEFSNSDLEGIGGYLMKSSRDALRELMEKAGGILKFYWEK